MVLIEINVNIRNKFIFLMFFVVLTTLRCYKCLIRGSFTFHSTQCSLHFHKPQKINSILSCLHNTYVTEHGCTSVVKPLINNTDNLTRVCAIKPATLRGKNSLFLLTSKPAPGKNSLSVIIYDPFVHICKRGFAYFSKTKKKH